VRTPDWLGLLACLLLVGAPCLLWPGGILDEETTQLLPGYWSSRGVLARIFDPAANDFGAYQARELSYAVDLGDASWLRAMLRSGHVWLAPLSGIVFPLAMTGVVVASTRRAFPALPPWLALLALALFLSNFVVPTTHALLYRSAKSGTTLLLLALLFQVCSALRGRRSPVRDAGLVFALASAMSLFDRQGAYETFVLTAVLALVWTTTRRGGGLLAGAAAAVAFALLYDLWLAPRLVHALNGYWPSLDYQRLPWHKLANPRFYREGAELAALYASTLFGGLPPAVLLSAAVAAGGALVVTRRGPDGMIAPAAPAPARQPAWLLPAAILLVAASQVVLFAAMVVRLRAVYEIREWLAYYALPFQALLLFGLLLLLEGVAVRGAAARRLCALALAALVCANLARWPELRAAMYASPAYGETLSRSALLRESLVRGQPDARLAGMQRDFYWTCRDRFPALFPPAVEAREGQGFLRTQDRSGRTFAWARAGSAIELQAAETGAYRLAFRAHLQEGDALQLDGADARPAFAPVPGSEPGQPPFTRRVVCAFDLRLPAGRSRVTIGSLASERVVDAERGLTAAFGVDFPILLYRLPAEP
jgi:hypothetical protein